MYSFQVSDGKASKNKKGTTCVTPQLYFKIRLFLFGQYIKICATVRVIAGGVLKSPFQQTLTCLA